MKVKLIAEIILIAFTYGIYKVVVFTGEATSLDRMILRYSSLSAFFYTIYCIIIDRKARKKRHLSN